VTCEAARNIAAERWRQARKDVVHQQGSIPCLYCNRTFRARIGLASHL